MEAAISCIFSKRDAFRAVTFPAESRACWRDWLIFPALPSKEVSPEETELFALFRICSPSEMDLESEEEKSPAACRPVFSASCAFSRVDAPETAAFPRESEVSFASEIRSWDWEVFSVNSVKSASYSFKFLSAFFRSETISELVEFTVPDRS